MNIRIFHFLEVFLCIVAGSLILVRFFTGSYIPLILVLTAGGIYKFLIEKLKDEIPEKSYGVHSGNALMIMVSSLVAIYAPGAFTLGILLLAISVFISFRVMLKPGGHPVKKNMSWNPTDNF